MATAVGPQRQNCYTGSLTEESRRPGEGFTHAPSYTGRESNVCLLHSDTLGARAKLRRDQKQHTVMTRALHSGSSTCRAC
jgi:hypothetical protein